MSPYPSQRLLTKGLLVYSVSDADLVSVTFSVEGFDGVNVVSRRQWARITKGAQELPSAPESAPSATTEPTVRPGR